MTIVFRWDNLLSGNHDLCIMVGYGRPTVDEDKVQKACSQAQNM